MGSFPPASLTRRQASPRASPLCPYLHMASSADNFGMHLLSTLGLQFLVSASSYKKIGKDEYTMFSQIVNFWKDSMTNYYTQSVRTWEFIKASMSRAAASVGFVETKASPALSPIIECRACRRLDGT